MSQTAQTRRLLLYENREKPGMRVAADLQKLAAAHRFEIEAAADVAAARHLLQTKAIAAAVIDVGRESGDVLALLRTIGNKFPSLPLFIFNVFMIPGIAEKVGEYGHVQYCENPHELPRFLMMIIESLSRKKKGVIEGIRLTNFLELLNIEKFTGRVVVSSGTRKGLLFLEQGFLIGAGSGGPAREAALAEISTWDKVSVEIIEGPVPDGGPAGDPFRPHGGRPAASREGGSIETLRLVRQGKAIVIRVREINQTVAVIREMLSASLLRMDIFLSADGRSLAGWHSHPLACSAFAGITRSLNMSLAASCLPTLGNYYLLDLDGEKMLMIAVCGELQLGMLLDGAKERMGFLINIVLPQALNALRHSCVSEPPS